MRCRLAVLLAALPLVAGSVPEIPSTPEALLPEAVLASWQADSLPELGRALAASPVYAGAVDGTWEGAAKGFLVRSGVEDRPERTVLWSALRALAPHVRGPVAAAWLPSGPVALARDADWKAVQAWAEGEARARGAALAREEIAGVPVLACDAVKLCVAWRDPWCVAARDRGTLKALLAAPERPLAASKAYREARAAAPGAAFLFVSPGALAASGFLGERLKASALAEGRAPFAEALGWGCAFGPDGTVTDTLRLLRPGRRPLLPASAGRLAAALPPGAAARVTGRLSARRLREILSVLLGEDPFREHPLLDAAAGWEGEAAFSASWTMIFPDILLGVESADPAAALAAALQAARDRGARVLDVPGDPAARTVLIPGQSLTWTMKPGERALWIGTLPPSVAKAAARPPAEAPAAPEKGLRLALRFPELLGPAAALGAALQGNPQAAPLAALLRARALWEISADEDAGGLTLVSRAPWGLAPLLATGLLGGQALGAYPVLEPPEAVTARVRDGLPGLRGLAFEKPLDIKVVTPAETRALFEKAFDKELPPARLSAMQAEMEAFGLFPPGGDLRAVLTGAFVDLVGGFYDPDTRGLYLIRGMPAQSVIAAHEMTHALQDQHFRLKELQEAMRELPANADRDAALLAVIEGDATLAMQEYLMKEVQADPFRGLRILLEILASPRLAVGQLMAARAMPDAMLRQTLFSYDEGMAFVSAVRGRGGWPAVGALFKDPPASTEQVLHPEKYLPARRDPPVAVPVDDLPGVLGAAWAPVAEDTLGELGIQSLLRHALPNATADRAAAGWGGDRFALFSRGGERLLVWRTLWDRPEEAEEFAGTLAEAQRRRYGEADAGGAWRHGASAARIVRAGGRVTLLDGPAERVLGAPGDALTSR